MKNWVMNAPVIFEPAIDLTDGKSQVWDRKFQVPIGVANVWTSLDTTYEMIGTIYGSAMIWLISNGH